MRKQERQCRRPAQLPEHLAIAGAIGALEIEIDRVGRAEAFDHADGDREEGQVRRDQRLGQEAGQADRGKDDEPYSPCDLPQTAFDYGAWDGVRRRLEEHAEWGGVESVLPAVAPVSEGEVTVVLVVACASCSQSCVVVGNVV